MLTPSQADKDLLLSNLTPKFFPKKNTLVPFLRAIYTNILKRSHGNFNSYTFQEINNLPLFCSDKIFFFISENLSSLSQNQFVDGIIFLLFGNLNRKIIATFQIYDFDDDDVINKDDVFLLLAHFHLIKNSNLTVNELEKVINSFFKDSESITRDEYLNRIQNENCDLALLLIIFINNYLLFFEQKEIRFFEKKVVGVEGEKKQSTKNSSKDESNNALNYGGIGSEIKLTNFFGDLPEIPTDYSKLDECLEKNIYRATSCLYNYLNLADLPKKYPCDDIKSDSSLSSEDDDLKDLVDFETDVTNAFGSLQALSNYFNNGRRGIAKNKTMKNKMKNPKMSLIEDEEEKLNKELNNTNNTKNEHNISSFFDDYNKQPKNNNTSANETTFLNYENIGRNKGFNKAVTEMGMNNPMQKRNEIIVYKNENNMKSNNNLVKLVLINKFIFYFKKMKNNLTFKRIIPLVSLYPKKLVTNSYPQLTLISTVHNYIKQYSFFCDNQTVLDSFYDQICENAEYKKLNNEIELKKELGKGKFGSVLLGIDKTIENLNKLYAVKTVNKNNPTEEEYKINRWESTIFNSLKNMNHPNIIKCYKKYENEKNIFFVYEFVKGSDLKVFSRLEKASHLVRNTLLIAKQIIRGLNELHKYGIIHRDIKTTNILIKAEGPELEDSVKIIDFGLSRVLGFHENSNDPYGSLCFKAPELIRHLPYSFKVDVWALGVTIFYLMFKELPFEKGNKQQIKNSIVNSTLRYPVDEEIFEDTILNSKLDSEEADEENQKNQGNSNKAELIYSLISDCLEKTVKMRPDTKQLMKNYVLGNDD